MTWIQGNRYLSQSEMENNAIIVRNYLTAKGWSMNAIAGLLGNMQSESTINPGIWQNLDENNLSGGFGLVQWTPATNFTGWADSLGLAWTDGNAQLRWIDEQTTAFDQWIPTDTYPMSFDDFKTSTQTPAYLASAFLKNFERAGVEVETQRQSQAGEWYSFITEGSTPTPTPGSGKKQKKFNFILFNRQRRALL